MKILDDVKLDFSDVLLLPKRSEYSSRSEVSLEREFKFKYSPYSWTGVPIMVANMDTTGTIQMALELQKHKVLTCLHKYYTSDELKDQNLDPEYYAVSTGINDNDLINLEAIIQEIPIKFICIDVANGYMTKFVERCAEIREKYPDKILIAGNVCTSEGVLQLITNGKVDIVKVGIGSGSCCTTRKQTGIGMPQLSAVIECADTAHGLNAHIISDGGLQVVGDFSKAYSGGADFVMSGSMFAGHKESGGELVSDEKTNELYKVFYGMSSTKAMEKYSGGVAKYRSSEGKAVKIVYRGPVENTILDIQGGIRSCMTYLGAKKIKDIPKCATFVRVNRQLNQIYNGREI
uniref:GMP reductase n=1 Tax=viral metagenome TaxID=1070528 RepID=A0A6C0ARW6_9ZZZZ